jgi:biopolymer transport protein ExbD
MGMSGGNGKGSAVSEINVTPLIDVLLVLLIIFMAIVPVAPKGLHALVPQPVPQGQLTEGDHQIIVSVTDTSSGTPTYTINTDRISKSSLEATLQRIFAVREDKIMFLKGDANLTYATMTDVIDMAHRAGVDHVGLITTKVEQGE